MISNRTECSKSPNTLFVRAAGRSHGILLTVWFVFVCVIDVICIDQRGGWRCGGRCGGASGGARRDLRRSHKEGKGRLHPRAGLRSTVIRIRQGRTGQDREGYGRVGYGRVR